MVERIYVIASAGKSDDKNEKGHAFEKAMKGLFTAYALEDVRLRSIGPGGEIDLTARHSLTDREVLAECKGHARKIDAKILMQAVGKLRSQVNSDAKDFFFFAAGGITPDAERMYGDLRKSNPNFYIFDARRIYDKLVNIPGTDRVLTVEELRRHWTGPELIKNEWLICTELGWYWAVALARRSAPQTKMWSLLTRHGRGAMVSEVERFSEPLLRAIPELHGKKYVLMPLSSAAYVAPPMRWRGGHFSPITRPIMEYLTPEQSPYAVLLVKLRTSIDSILKPKRYHMWKNHCDQVIKYSGELIPDEIKETVSNFELACVYAVALRSAEIQLRKRKEPVGRRLQKAAETALSEDAHFGRAVDAVVRSLLENRDVVMDAATRDSADNLDFVLATQRLVSELDLSLSRIPKERYTELCPYHDVSDNVLQEPQFRIDAIDLDYNLHQIVVRAVCGDAEIHQVIATLSDFAGQTLNAVGPALDARNISLLKVALQVTPVGYEGRHYEFRTQVSSVISMFMGEELYGQQRVFLRELLQNARDAVVTRAQLKSKNANTEYEPAVTMTLDSDSQRFVCRDNGIGMDRYTIERYLADIGRSFYTSDDYRNLIAGASDEQLSPVSRFGIGILSFFMVANTVIMRTRREGETGYRINIPSRGAFFFVEEDESIEFVGTEVTLELNANAMEKGAPWRREHGSRRTKEIDLGVLADINGKLTPANRDRETKKYLVDRGWKLSRLVSAYAVDLPFPVEVIEDGVRCVIPKHRLSDSLKRVARTCIAEIRGFPLSATVTYSHHRDISITSCGGIFVARMNDLKLNSLGLPNWNDYLIDAAPQRTRINLARTNIMDFELNQSEQLEVWRVISQQIDDWRKVEFGKVTRDRYITQMVELWKFIRTLPEVAQSLKRKMALQYHYVAMLRYSRGKWEAWFGPLRKLRQSGSTKLVLAHVTADPREFRERTITHHPRAGEALALDCNLGDALATANISMAYEELEKGTGQESSHTYAMSSVDEAKELLAKAKLGFFQLAVSNGNVNWMPVNAAKIEAAIDKIENAATQLEKVLIDEKNDDGQDEQDDWNFEEQEEEEEGEEDSDRWSDDAERKLDEEAEQNDSEDFDFDDTESLNRFEHWEDTVRAAFKTDMDGHSDE